MTAAFLGIERPTVASPATQAYPVLSTMPSVKASVHNGSRGRLRPMHPGPSEFVATEPLTRNAVTSAVFSYRRTRRGTVAAGSWMPSLRLALNGGHDKRSLTARSLRVISTANPANGLMTSGLDTLDNNNVENATSHIRNKYLKRPETMAAFADGRIRLAFDRARGFAN